MISEAAIHVSAPLAAFATYFSSVAQVGGALLGLVFVALTFNPKTLGMRHDLGLRSLAEQVFADFLMVMIVSLILLIPGHVAPGIGFAMAILAAVGIVRLIRSAIALLYNKHAMPWVLVQRFGLSLLGNVGFLVAGIFMSSGKVPSVAGLALLGSPLLLLLSGSRSAWFLVMRNTD